LKLALYDLSKNPTTYDFTVFAVVAKTLGYEEVRFLANDIGHYTARKYPPSIAWRRWANVCVPICGLAGLRFHVHTVREGDEFGYHTGAIVAVHQKTGKISKLQAIKTPLSGHVTITMRRSNIHQWRDSNIEAWKKTKEWLEARGETVIVLEDCEFAPLFVEQRMALYGSAKMNLSVGNGPMVLCWLSEAPYLSFQLPHGTKEEEENLAAQWKRLGFPVGSQLAFRNPRQEIVWGPDDFDLIKEKYEQLDGHQPYGEAVPRVSQSGN
jgi:hypothetical protein